MNELVRMRNSHARRFEPGSKLAHATIARSSVSWTRSFALSGLRQIRIATPYSSAWCGRHAVAKSACCGFTPDRTASAAPVAFDSVLPPSMTRSAFGADVVRRTMRDAVGLETVVVGVEER